MFLNNNFNKTLPCIVLNDEDKKLIALVNRELKQYIQLMDHIKYVIINDLISGTLIWKGC